MRDVIKSWFSDEQQTEQIKPETTQVHELKTIYTIPFSKAKVAELAPDFSDNVGFMVKERATGNRTDSCSRREFTELSFEEIIDLKTGFAEYSRSKQHGQLKEGGIK